MPLKEVNWDEFVFRCHYLGELMTPSKGKSNLEKYDEAFQENVSIYNRLSIAKDGAARDKLLKKMIESEDKLKILKLNKDKILLSETCKSRLSQIYTEETTGRKKDVQSLYIQKGIDTEEDSITLYSLRTNTMYRKNKERVSNEFITGEIDFDDEEDGVVIDTKSTWDIFSFDKKVKIGIGKIYEWQGHGYMWLKNRDKFRVAYCLNNTPQKIIDQLIKRLEYNFIGDKEQFEEAKLELINNHNFDDLPIHRKIRIYEMERSEEKIDLIKSSIPNFREYLKNYKDNKFDDYEPS